MVLPSSHKVSRVSWYSLIYISSLCFVYRNLTFCVVPSHALQLHILSIHISGYFPFARRYLGNRFFFLFLRVLRWFSSPRSPLHTMDSCVSDRSSSAGLPHSDICESTVMCTSSQLFAACHVLLRLLMQRHSPCALISFFLRFFNFVLYSRFVIFLS